MKSGMYRLILSAGIGAWSVAAPGLQAQAPPAGPLAPHLQLYGKVNLRNLPRGRAAQHRPSLPLLPFDNEEFIQGKAAPVHGGGGSTGARRR